VPLPIPHDPPTPRGRRRALGALGVELARRGILALLSLGIAALTVLGAIAAAFIVARGGPRPPLERVPGVAASALAWGAGVLLAFAASAQALRRDRTEGITALLRARGASVRTYVWLRVGGLTALLLFVVAGGAFTAGVAATLVATRAGLALRALQGTAAAVAYGAAFALTLGPLAMAALGARSRAGGYFWLLMVLLVPEMLTPLTEALAPSGWSELVSIPGALGALRAALMPPGIHLVRAVKAMFVLALIVAASVAVVARAARTARREEAP
jgi:hypothetical protein